MISLKIFRNTYLQKVIFYMKTKLLCTFSTTDEYMFEVDLIKKYYDIVFQKIYALQNEDDLDKIMLTYNINEDMFTTKSFYKNTISVHRKKDSNTLYTINSINELIKSLNGGIMDFNFKVNWQDYSNTLLLTDPSGYKQVKTKLFKIIKI